MQIRLQFVRAIYDAKIAVTSKRASCFGRMRRCFETYFTSDILRVLGVVASRDDDKGLCLGILYVYEGILLYAQCYYLK